jgi:hypothetical protein
VGDAEGDAGLHQGFDPLLESADQGHPLVEEAEPVEGQAGYEAGPLGPAGIFYRSGGHGWAAV